MNRNEWDTYRATINERARATRDVSFDDQTLDEHELVYLILDDRIARDAVNAIIVAIDENHDNVPAIERLIAIVENEYDVIE